MELALVLLWYWCKLLGLECLWVCFLLFPVLVCLWLDFILFKGIVLSLGFSRLVQLVMGVLCLVLKFRM